MPTSRNSRLNRLRRLGSLKLLLPLAALALLVYACSEVPVYNEPLPTAAPVHTVSYQRDIQPIFDAKCVSCHACYDAPCQLKLSSGEGVDRGASKLLVYDASRLKDQAPTRLYVDAQSTLEWRHKGFFSVLNSSSQSNSLLASLGAKVETLHAKVESLQAQLDPPADTASAPQSTPKTASDPTAPEAEKTRMQASLLYRMVEFGRQNPPTPNARIPDDVDLSIYRANQCPTLDEFDDFRSKSSNRGMPFAVTGLSDAEFNRIRTWVAEGAAIDTQPMLPAKADVAEIFAWEDFLNQSGAREQLVARYIFEHLFIAHLYFEDSSSSSGTPRFYELVRSYTPSGETIQPVATPRPNDAVDRRFYYRLRPLAETIVHKTHITYPLSLAKLKHVQQLFLSDDWQAPEPSPDQYSSAAAGNPFATFAAIPARARYQFMLDNAEYFVRTFIRGPVCRGQIATDVIRDHFWTLFQAPEQDLYITNASYRDQVTPLLGLPGLDSDLLALGPEWVRYTKRRNQYKQQRSDAYAQQEPNGTSLADLWHGDGHNRDALLTIFRHQNSASVTRGLVGELPSTIWVMDYPLFERTYYSLVVNFNVFGSVSHQAQTRLYFDLIREGAESNFLRFLPASKRKALRDHWYQQSGQLKLLLAYADIDTQTPTRLAYHDGDPMQEFTDQVLTELAPVAGPADSLNRCTSTHCMRPGMSDLQIYAEDLLRLLVQRQARDLPVIKQLPEVTLLRIQGNSGERQMYSILRNRYHTNVAFILGEDLRLEPDKDTLTITNGVIASYPNFIFDVREDDLSDFIIALQAARDSAGFESLVRHWGVRRTNPQFWDVLHDIQAYMRETTPIEAGILDLNRYENF